MARWQERVVSPVPQQRGVATCQKRSRSDDDHSVNVTDEPIATIYRHPTKDHEAGNRSRARFRGTTQCYAPREYREPVPLNRGNIAHSPIDYERRKAGYLSCCS